MSSHPDINTALASALSFALGAFMLFRTRQAIARAQEIHNLKVSDRMARGSDAYFEELRSLQAYSPTTVVWKMRVGGAALLALGAAGLIFSFVLQ